jgi:hypothetical protein
MSTAAAAANNGLMGGRIVKTAIIFALFTSLVSSKQVLHFGKITNLSKNFKGRARKP